MRRRDFDRKWRRPADDDLVDLLRLVSVDATVESIAGWTDDERRDAEWWALHAHLRASDNPVRRYPEPETVKRLPRLGFEGVELTPQGEVN